MRNRVSGLASGTFSLLPAFDGGCHSLMRRRGWSVRVSRKGACVGDGGDSGGDDGGICLRLDVGGCVLYLCLF